MAGVVERGISADPVVTMGNGVRTAWVADPDGNRIQVGQPPDR
ncbi:MAG: VOC family protein [Chloroflexi bacterium]|nr:MAG: VOC family protein [Chloroflexota bacterium]